MVHDVGLPRKAKIKDHIQFTSSFSMWMIISASTLEKAIEIKIFLQNLTVVTAAAALAASSEEIGP